MGQKIHKLLIQIKEGFLDSYKIFLEESRKVVFDQGVLIFFMVVPLLYPLLYTFIYNNEQAREVPCVIVDKSNSTLSRKYTRSIDATPDLKVVGNAYDMEQAKMFMKKHKAEGIIYIPETFSKDINSFKQTCVRVYCSMDLMLNYKAFKLANSNVSLSMSDDISIERMGQPDERLSSLAVNPIKYKSIALFNPTKGFASAIIPGVLILIIQQTLILGIGLSVGTEREKNKQKKFRPTNVIKQGTYRVIIGKAACYFVIYSIMSLYCTILVPWMFHLAQIPHLGTLLLFMIPYIGACIFFAMTISVFVLNREVVMPIFVFSSALFLFLSGLSWPSFAIPSFWKYISYLIPSTFGINGFVRINTMGATLSQVGFEYHALWLQFGIYSILAAVVYHWQLGSIQFKRHIIKRNRLLAGMNEIQRVKRNRRLEKKAQKKD